MRHYSREFMTKPWWNIYIQTLYGFQTFYPWEALIIAQIECGLMDTKVKYSRMSCIHGVNLIFLFPPQSGSLIGFWGSLDRWQGGHLPQLPDNLNIDKMHPELYFPTTLKVKNLWIMGGGAPMQGSWDLKKVWTLSHHHTHTLVPPYSQIVIVAKMAHILKQCPCSLALQTAPPPPPRQILYICLGPALASWDCKR